MKIVTFTPNPAIDCFIKVNSFEQNEISNSICDYISAGGKGINVSKILCHLNIQNTALFTQGGNDGRLLHELLRKDSVPFSCFDIKNETRRNYVIENSDGLRWKINGKAPTLPDQSHYQDLADWVLLHCRKDDILYIGGSLIEALGESFYTYISEKALSKLVKLAFDVSEKYIKTVMEIPFSFLKANLNEFSGLSGKRFETLEEAADLLVALQLSEKAEIIVSAGKQGGILFAQSKKIRAVSSKIFDKLCVGCGDSLFAGYLAMRTKGKGLEDSFKFATALALSCANSPIYSLAEPESAMDFLKYITVNSF